MYLLLLLRCIGKLAKKSNQAKSGLSSNGKWKSKEKTIWNDYIDESGKLSENLIYLCKEIQQVVTNCSLTCPIGSECACYFFMSEPAQCESLLKQRTYSATRYQCKPDCVELVLALQLLSSRCKKNLAVLVWALLRLRNWRARKRDNFSNSNRYYVWLPCIVSSYNWINILQEKIAAKKTEVIIGLCSFTFESE